MEKEMSCPSCGFQNPLGQQYCGACGAKQTVQEVPEMIVCPSCGVEVQVGQQFCGTCGGKIEAVAAAESLSPTQSETRKQSVSSEEEAAAGSFPLIEQEAIIKPTWQLAWGLFWRMVLLSIPLCIAIYIIVMVILLATEGAFFP